MLFKILSLFEHRVSRYISDATEDDSTWLTGRVKIYCHQHSGGAHQMQINLTFGPMQ